MKCVLIPLALVAILATANAQPENCLTEHCRTEVLACEESADCRDELACTTKCLELLPEDPTPQKLRVQNCTNKCAFSYANEAFAAVFKCAVENDCLKLPPVPNPCRRNNITVTKDVPPSALAGTWWSVRGYNPVYDCYPCQKNTFEAGAMQDEVRYRATYDAIKVDGSRTPVTAEGTLMVNTNFKEGYKMVVTIAGLVPSEETWWVVDAVESGGETYVLAYYCAATLEWYSDGAIVFSKTTELSPAALPAINTAYKAALGMDFDVYKFCRNDNTRCEM